MPHEPKKRHSRQRQGKHRAHMSIVLPIPTACPQCKEMKLSHIACSHCGYYDGRSVLTIKDSAQKKDKHTHEKEG